MPELDRSAAGQRPTDLERAQVHFVGLRPHDALDLKIPAGKTETLAAGAPKFERHLVRITPKSIAEVRRYLGPTINEPLPRTAGATARELDRQVVSLDALEADDPETRAGAHALAYLASREIVSGTMVPEYWHPIADRYLAVNKAVLTIALLRDIDVANRATLVISSGIQAVYARHIRIHGSGRIRCDGRVTVRATDLEGEWIWQVPNDVVLNRAVSS